MSYIKINGEDTKYYVSIMPFTTQHGYNAIKFIGDNIPKTDKGFILYDDDDNIVSDFSEYTHLYRNNEYSIEQDNIEYPQWSDKPVEPSAINKLNKRVSALNNQVNSITPYTETKTVYIGEKECIFDKVVNGNISAYLEIGGEQMPCDITVGEKYITVSFDEAIDLGSVTISIL